MESLRRLGLVTLLIVIICALVKDPHGGVHAGSMAGRRQREC
jgi:hypothetical protein